MAKIEYDNKVALNDRQEIPEVNKGTAGNFNEIKEKHNGNDDRIENLETNQVSGQERYNTVADLPVTGVATTVYLVANDPTPENNGYYAWNGSSYDKTDYQAITSSTDTVTKGSTEPVESGGVFDYGSTNTVIKSFFENGDLNGESNLYSAQTDIEVVPEPIPNIFKSEGISNAFKMTYPQTETYTNTGTDTKNNPIAGQYVKWEYKIYVEAGDYPPTLSRLRPLVFGDFGQYILPTGNLIRISEGEYKVTGYGHIDVVGTVSNVWLETVWLDTYPSGSVYLSGFKMASSLVPDFTLSEDYVFQEVNTKTRIENTKALAEKNGVKIDFLQDEVGKILAVPSVVTGGNYTDGVARNFTGESIVETTNNTYLNSIGCYNGGRRAVGGNGNIEIYNRLPQDMFNANIGKYHVSRIYAYTTEPNKPPTEGRVKFVWVDDSGTTSKVANVPDSGVTMTKVDDYTWLIETNVLLDATGTITERRLTVLWEAADTPTDGIASVTGYAAFWGDNETDVFKKLKNDWDTDDEGGEVIVENTWNNVQYNRGQISPFLRQYLNKEVDETNQLNIVSISDSIWARLYQTQIEYTPGQENGHFPPNAWQQQLPYKVGQYLKWVDEDVQYFNYEANEVTFGGTWTPSTNVDNNRFNSTVEIGANFSITVTGVKFLKALWSISSGGANFDVLVNGVLPSSLGFTSSTYDNPDLLHSTNGGHFVGKHMKWANQIWSGLDENVSYTFTFTNKYASGFTFWGFETWSNPRINIINAGVGGQTAGSHNGQLYKFCNQNYNPQLIIHELPCINDSYALNHYKGSKTPSSAAISGSDGYFIYAEETGTYVNYSNLELFEGDFAEYQSGTWIKGSSTAEASVNAFNSSIVYLDELLKFNVPVICFNPHRSVDTVITRPLYQLYVKLGRLKCQENGFAFVDMDKKGLETGLSGDLICADGVHLNDLGVQQYEEEFIRVLDKEIYNADATAKQPYKSKSGTVLNTDSRTVIFDVEYLKGQIPTVTLNPYNDGTIPTFMYVDSVNEFGFTVIGTGAFKWKSRIN